MSKRSDHDVESGSGAAERDGGAPSSLLSKRWGVIFGLGLTVFVRTKISAGPSAYGANDGYEPLVGRDDDIFHSLTSRGADKGNTNSALDRLEGYSDDAEVRRTHPRVACIADADEEDPSPPDCQFLIKHSNQFEEGTKRPPAIPAKEDFSSMGDGSSSGDFTDVYEEETDQCKLSDPAYQTIPAAPSTCNDMHSMPFRFGPTDHDPISGINGVYLSRHQIKYLTRGSFRAVWTVTQLDETEGAKERVILKTNRLSRGWSAHYLDHYRRDILISERAPIHNPLSSNLLPVYQNCGYSSIVPFSTAGPLDEYVHKRTKRGDILSAEEQYLLAIQAARGLYQSHLYRDGKATNVHADVKPDQFLLFDRPKQHNSDVPVLQISDFNRGKFLTRNVTNENETCPFRMCHVHHKGSTYRSPEELMDCADQDDAIDVFALGGVFYFLLSDGEKPWYYLHNYDKAVKLWLKGEKPRLPAIDEHASNNKNLIVAKERSKHPAFVALTEVMMKCWAFKPEDRPSSLEVVKMLEDKWKTA